jgi:cytochrome c-type biogenesis protein CcmE
VTTVESPPVAPLPPPRPRRRARYVVAIGGCVVAVLAIIVLAVVLSQNVVYFRTVSEAVHSRTSEGTSRFRLAGGVVNGSIHDTNDGVTFRVTDGKATVVVHHQGDTPALFKNGAPVVVEGHWASKRTNAPFDSDRILIKHGADYTPPKVDTNGGGTNASKPATKS